MSFSKKLGSYPGLLIIISLTVALFLIGFCGWIAISSRELIKYVKQNIEVQVDLNDNLSQAQIDEIKTEITKLNIAENTAGIKYISKEVAAKMFFKDSKESFQDILDDNPLKNSFSIKVKEGFINEKNLAEIKNKLIKIKNIYQVDYAKDFLKGVIVNVNKIYKILALVVLIFFVATLLLINNTIKLALYSQRFIIRTMQLVGATDFFIQKPFILKGISQGLIASVISIILIFITKTLAADQIEGLTQLQNNQALLILFGILLILGPLIGSMSTLQSISRYHKMDLDKLY